MPAILSKLRTSATSRAYWHWFVYFPWGIDFYRSPILVTLLPSSVLYCLFRMAILPSTAGWIGISYPFYVRRLTHLVRAAKLSPNKQFEVRQFLSSSARVRNNPIVLVTLFFVAATAYMLRLDQRNYYLFTDSYIEYVDYWTSKPHRLAYAEAYHVEIGCNGLPSYRVRLDKDHGDICWQHTTRNTW